MLPVRTPAICTTFAVALGLLGLLLPEPQPRKKILEWGWDEPETAFLRTHIREMERTPFDGCVFSVGYGNGGRGGSFTWEFWGRRGFDRSDVARAFADLHATRRKTFREMFLRVNVTPAELDWFDDFTPILRNARLAGELARAGRARGILLDVEQYQGKPFDYSQQRQATSRSWDEYAAQARTRGRELMAAFQEGDPGLTLFLTFGYTLPRVLSAHGARPLAATPYGLLAPFLDGLLAAAVGGTRIVDGFELSYGFKEPGQFEDARRLFATGVLPIVADPRRYRARMQLGFGLWLDYDWRRQGWDAADVTRNYLPPEAFRRALGAALLETDTHVWIYSERTRWWHDATPVEGVPPGYVSVLREAQRR